MLILPGPLQALQAQEPHGGCSAHQRAVDQRSIITEYLRLWRRLQLSGITLDNQVADQIAWTVGGGTYYSARAAYKHKPQQGRLEMLGVRDCQDVRVAASQEQAFVQ